MRRTKALASLKFYQILSIFIFFIRLIILEDFIRLISYNGPCVRLGCSFFLATALPRMNDWAINYFLESYIANGFNFCYCCSFVFNLIVLWAHRLSQLFVLRIQQGPIECL